MKTIYKFRIAVLIIFISLLVSCDEQVPLPRDTSEALITDHRGAIRLIDDKGNRVLSCKERKGSDDECRSPAGFFSELCKKSHQSEEPVQNYKLKTDVKKGNPRDVKQVICIFSYRINPHCQTTVDPVTGQEYERCR